jgi:preprotein translocase subunit SecE
MGDFIERMKKFFKEVRNELKKVTWPTRSELGSYSMIVAVTVIFVAILIWMLDAGFNAVTRYFF